jgi:hypothetical protein
MRIADRLLHHGLEAPIAPGAFLAQVGLLPLQFPQRRGNRGQNDFRC